MSRVTVLYHRTENRQRHRIRDFTDPVLAQQQCDALNAVLEIHRARMIELGNKFHNTDYQPLEIVDYFSGLFFVTVDGLRAIEQNIDQIEDGMFVNVKFEIESYEVRPIDGYDTSPDYRDTYFAILGKDHTERTPKECLTLAYGSCPYFSGERGEKSK
jgi:hypothetical protein